MRDRYCCLRFSGSHRFCHRFEFTFRPAFDLGRLFTACDVIAVLYLQNQGFRLIEALVLTLIGVIATSFAIQIFLSRPDFRCDGLSLRAVAGNPA